MRLKRLELWGRALGNNLLWAGRGMRPTHDVATLEELCAASAIQQHAIPEWEPFHYRPRKLVGDSDAILMSPEVQSRLDAEYLRNLLSGEVHSDGYQPQLVTLPEGRVFSDGAIAITADNRLLAELNSGSLAGAPDSGAKSKYYGRLPPVRKVDATVGVLASLPARNNYYHWTIEVLPKLLFYRNAGIEPDYFFTHYKHAFQKQMLMLFGISADRVIPATSYEHIQAERLLVPSQLHMPMHRRSAEFLNSTALAAIEGFSTNASPTKKIYISRKRCKYRRIINEDELTGPLTESGFQCVVMEDLSILDQILLFQQAEIVVGSHGAGLSNLAFAPESTRIVEIGTPFRLNPCMYHVACARGQAYSMYLGEPVDPGYEESNISVDVDSLMDVVSE